MIVVSYIARKHLYKKIVFLINSERIKSDKDICKQECWRKKEIEFSLSL
jgi:hypothetical protein